MKAHLDYHSACREYLQRMRMQCAPAPGTGSVEDSQRAEQHDRLLPPLYVDKDLMVYLPMEEISLTMTRRLYNYLLENLETVQEVNIIETNVRRRVCELALSWTRFCNTVHFFARTMSHEDAQFFGIDYSEIQDMLHNLCCPCTCPFLAQHCKPRSKDLDALESECLDIADLLEQSPPIPKPRIYGRHRVVLHAYSGRRQVGDLQYYLDILAAKQTNFILHVISLDIIIDRDWEDVSNPSTCNYWGWKPFASNG